MKKKLSADFLLLITSLVWGFAFVAQRAGMQYIGPFLFNGIRFLIGAIILFAICIFLKRPMRERNGKFSVPLISGLLLFGGASLQQIGLVYTTAGNAGFITGLYIVFIPLIGLLIGQRTPSTTWLGILLGLTGMYLLTETASLDMRSGDYYVFGSALLFALHVIWVGRSVRASKTPLTFAALQFLYCGAFSLGIALLFEGVRLEAIIACAIPLLYGGCVSVGIGYTLQVIAQQKADPAHAALIMSLESVFAALGGWLLLSEQMSAQALFGCVLMLLAMLVSQGILLRRIIILLHGAFPAKQKNF